VALMRADVIPARVTCEELLELTNRMRLLALTALFLGTPLSMHMMVAQTATGDIFGSGIVRPPAVPLVTLIGIGVPGKMANDPAIPPKGPVARVVSQEFRLDARTQSLTSEVSSTVTTEFDESGQQIRRTETNGIAETRVVTTYEAGHIRARETNSFRQGKPNGLPVQERWTYDGAGRVIDFQRGQGDTLQNHLTKVAYDRESRLTSLEYHQGPADELFSRTEYTYQDGGNLIRMVETGAHGEQLQVGTSVLKDGRVAAAEYAQWDSETSRLSKPQRVAFRYDAKGRLVEQDAQTDEPDDGPGAEESVPPGKITLTYDDAQHTRTITYIHGDESMISKVRTDDAGSTLAWGMSIGQSEPSFQAELECSYDAHGNWTECRRWVTEGSRRHDNGLWRRAITYR
jgi:hypothetical protein